RCRRAHSRAERRHPGAAVQLHRASDAPLGRRTGADRATLQHDVMISAHDISFAYGDTLVLDGVELRAGPGQVLGLIGPNGSGKTTLLRTLYASLTPRA